MPVDHLIRVAATAFAALAAAAPAAAATQQPDWQHTSSTRCDPQQPLPPATCTASAEGSGSRLIAAARVDTGLNGTAPYNGCCLYATASTTASGRIHLPAGTSTVVVRVGRTAGASWPGDEEAWAYTDGYVRLGDDARRLDERGTVTFAHTRADAGVVPLWVGVVATAYFFKEWPTQSPPCPFRPCVPDLRTPPRGTAEAGITATIAVELREGQEAADAAR